MWKGARRARGKGWSVCLCVLVVRIKLVSPPPPPPPPLGDRVKQKHTASSRCQMVSTVGIPQSRRQRGIQRLVHHVFPPTSIHPQSVTIPNPSLRIRLVTIVPAQRTGGRECRSWCAARGCSALFWAQSRPSSTPWRRFDFDRRSTACSTLLLTRHTPRVTMLDSAPKSWASNNPVLRSSVDPGGGIAHHHRA